MPEEQNLFDPATREQQEAGQAKVAEAVKEPKAAKGDAAILAAQEAELKRQEAVEKAVAKANADELPKLGGSMKNPGLGR